MTWFELIGLFVKKLRSKRVAVNYAGSSQTTVKDDRTHVWTIRIATGPLIIKTRSIGFLVSKSPCDTNRATGPLDFYDLSRVQTVRRPRENVSRYTWKCRTDVHLSSYSAALAQSVSRDLFCFLRSNNCFRLKTCIPVGIARGRYSNEYDLLSNVS